MTEKMKSLIAYDGSGCAEAALVWNRLHSEREDICETLLKESAHSFADAHPANGPRELLEARLRKLDDALDRLFSGSYGKCSKCGKLIEDLKLEVDAAATFCRECSNVVDRSSPSGASIDSVVFEGVTLNTLQPFDTIWVSTHNSDYQFLMLDPQMGRVLAQGGRYFAEPVEAIIGGSTFDNSILKNDWIGVGARIEMWFDDRFIITSAVRSIRVEHCSSLELACA